MKKRLKLLAEKILPIDRNWDWEERGFDGDFMTQTLQNTFRGELDHIRLYDNKGENKWIFLGDYHNQPVIIGVGRYSSPDHFRRECRLLNALNRTVPRYFPSTSRYFMIDPSEHVPIYGRFSKPVISVCFVEGLVHMDTVYTFREKIKGLPEYKSMLEALAEQEGYAAGFVLGKTELVLTDPHSLNTLVYPVSSQEFIIKFIDAERIKYCGDLGTSIKILIDEYTRVSHLRIEVIHNKDLFMRGLEQGLQDSEADDLP